jgi:hypothetical protein
MNSITPGELKGELISEPALRVDVMREVATAKIAEFENQVYRLGWLIAAGVLDRADAADLLLSVADNNGLVQEHGGDFIQEIIARGVARQ